MHNLPPTFIFLEVYIEIKSNVVVSSGVQPQRDKNHTPVRRRGQGKGVAYELVVLLSNPR